MKATNSPVLSCAMTYIARNLIWSLADNGILGCVRKAPEEKICCKTWITFLKMYQPGTDAGKSQATTAARCQHGCPRGGHWQCYNGYILTCFSLVGLLKPTANWVTFECWGIWKVIYSPVFPTVLCVSVRSLQKSHVYVSLSVQSWIIVSEVAESDYLN